ncbi:MAG TPA: hypothetical protein VK177_09665 [Flavobacteriales bacterium]|nr:hypothetical protein [Flavobacteriales bacterium]
MKKNIQFNYLYRDAGNYKNHGSVVFSNPASLSLEEIDKAIRARLIEGVWFLHEDFGVPPLFFNDHDVNGDDHGWHEYVGVESCCDKALQLIDELIKLISKLQPSD